MSLTSFIVQPDVRERLRQVIRNPVRISSKPPLLAPVLTKRYTLVGTAFDYLFRFYLEHLNRPIAVTRKWVAESAIAYCVEEEVLDRADVILKKAKKSHEAYVRSGKIRQELLESALGLAQLDFILRSKQIPADLGRVHQEDIEDLDQLLSLLDDTPFKARNHCILNPTFGEGSRLVEGADADVILDGTLIELKTVKQCRVRAQDLDQLVGYYLLTQIGGVDGVGELEIQGFGLYFPRHGYLLTAPIPEVLDEVKLPDLLSWFEERAKRT